MKLVEKDWSPSSWRAYPTRHQPAYRGAQELAQALATIRSLPPLVRAGDVDRLKAWLGRAQAGDALVLQAGDCAESFDACTAAYIGAQVSVISDMCDLLSRQTGRPTVGIGRIAGQYAKPRSTGSELVDGRLVPSFLGDNVNGYRPEEREPDPRRLVQAYVHAKATLSHLSALAPEGDLFTSHEGLLLPYEECQTRYVAERGAWYNLSAHMLWIGERTRALDEGHVEYFRGIANPIGIKVGPDADPDEIIAVVSRLNPRNEAGKIVLITRYGAARAHRLGRMVAAVSAAQLRVLWLCDPMHGNTTKSPSGLKTRAVTDIEAEIRGTWQAHAEGGTAMGGLHLEVSGQAVTECLGGSEGITHEQLPLNYQTKCDPRLSRSQAIEVSQCFAELVADRICLARRARAVTGPGDRRR